MTSQATTFTPRPVSVSVSARPKPLAAPVIGLVAGAHGSVSPTTPRTSTATWAVWGFPRRGDPIRVRVGWQSTPRLPPREAVLGHPRIVAALLVVATLIAFLAIFSIWVNRQALNTDNWVHTSDKILQNEEVRTQLSNYLANELFANVDVQAELEKTFPPRLAPLAGPAAGALHQLAPKVAERALETSQAESLWSDANRGAHETLLKILNDEGSSVSTSGGEVTLDLNPCFRKAAASSGSPASSPRKFPPKRPS